MHLYGDMPEFVERAHEDGFRVLTINVNYRDFPPLAQQQHDAVALRAPTRIASPSRRRSTPRAASGPAGCARTEQDLEAAFGQGAVAVKVWKDIGMQQRDADGRAVMIDDPRFDPLFAWLEQRARARARPPGRAAQRLAAARPDDDPRRPRVLRGASAIPHGPARGMAELRAAGRRARPHARQAPGLTFVGVHLASLEWDVDRVAAFLRHYPNASVDLAARLSHLELQASKDRDKVRQFFIEFQDRILYGSDFARGRDQADAEFATEAHEGWLADWRFLGGNGELHSDEFDAPFRGLELPREVLDKVYRENARRIFPTAWRGTAGSGT